MQAHGSQRTCRLCASARSVKRHPSGSSFSTHPSRQESAVAGGRSPTQTRCACAHLGLSTGWRQPMPNIFHTSCLVTHASGSSDACSCERALDSGQAAHAESFVGAEITVVRTASCRRSRTASSCGASFTAFRRAAHADRASPTSISATPCSGRGHAGVWREFRRRSLFASGCDCSPPPRRDGARTPANRAPW